MRKILSLFLIILALCVLFVSCGDSEEKGKGGEVIADASGLSYREVDGAYAVSIGTQTNATKVEIPSTYNGKSVSRIDAEGFKNATSLKNVIIPSSVRVIENGAFSGCTALKEVIIITDDVDMRFTTIEKGAFYGCTALEDINIPNSLTTLGDDAFYGCTSLDFAEYKDGFYIGNNTNPYLVFIKAKTARAYDIELHSDTRFINDFAFANCEQLKSVTLYGGIVSYGKDAFSGCVLLNKVNYFGNFENWCRATFSSETSNPLNKGAELFMEGTLATTVTVPNNIEEINDFAFIGCTSIKEVSLPEGLTKIGKRAFERLANLEKITLSSNLTSVGDDAFKGCGKIERVDYVGEIDTWCAIDFANKTASPFGAGADLYINDELVTEIVIPVTLDAVKDYAFANCKSLKTVIILGRAQNVGKSIFSGCTSLTEIHCQASEKPSSWSENWLDGCTASVNWGLSGE